MCGRFRQTRSQKQLAERFDAEGDVEVVPRFNIAPTDPLVTVRQEKGKASRRLSTMRWGLIPSWTLLANSAYPIFASLSLKLGQRRNLKLRPLGPEL
jgi:putative SOS response-associated peptidase YedK